MVNSTKQKKEVFFSRGTTQNSYLLIYFYRLDHRPIPFLFGSIEYTHNSELHITPPKRHIMSDPGHPNSIEWNDSFSFLICKIIISIKSHIAVY